MIFFMLNKDPPPPCVLTLTFCVCTFCHQRAAQTKQTLLKLFTRALAILDVAMLDVQMQESQTFQV